MPSTFLPLPLMFRIGEQSCCRVRQDRRRARCAEACGPTDSSRVLQIYMGYALFAWVMIESSVMQWRIRNSASVPNSKKGLPHARVCDGGCPSQSLVRLLQPPETIEQPSPKPPREHVVRERPPPPPPPPPVISVKPPVAMAVNQFGARKIVCCRNFFSYRHASRSF